MSGNLVRHILSKSTFMRGCQCRKSLWLHKHRPDLRDEMDDSRKAIFTQGTNVGMIARELFPGGVDASPATPYEYQQSVIDTANYIQQGYKTVYEAAFQFDGVLAAIDILVKKGKKWIAYEVKSSTSVKDPYRLDAALQYYVLSNSGIELQNLFIVYINGEYVRNGAIDPGQLFTRESVLQHAIEQQAFIKEQIRSLKKLLSQPEMPALDIGPQCSDPYPCDFTGYCRQHIPEESVFDLRGRGGFSLALDLYKKGVFSINDIPHDQPIGNGQRVQVDVHRSGKPIIDKKAIKEFLDGFVYPLCFMDFETFNSAVPEHDGCWPYQQIPFQFSIHVVHTPDQLNWPKEKVEHRCFLAEHNTDPRLPFLETMLKNVGDKGSIVVYNQSFENGRLNDLAETFPAYVKKIQAVQSRMIDLMLPFRTKDYYLPQMKGSYSIKEVLPAVVPELSYDELAINNGASASQAFCSLKNEKDEAKLEKIRRQLLEYCQLDTWGMVKILGRLADICRRTR